MKPVRCFKKTHELKSQLNLVGGLDMLCNLWGIPPQEDSKEALLAVQVAMIRYEIASGLMSESFLIRARICVNLERSSAVSKPELALTQLEQAVKSGSIPFGRRSKKTFIDSKKFVEVHGWSIPFESSIYDRIRFLEGEKIFECDDLAESYPAVFPKLPGGCEYLSGVLKKVRHKS